MGDAVQISGATDRESQIRLTLERLKADKLKQAQLEVDELLRQTEGQMSALLQQAQEQASAIEAEGQANREAILEEARQQGYAAGYQAGYDDGIQASETDTHAMLLSANVLLVRAYDAQKAVLGNIAPQASKIMQALVERVVHHQLDHLTLEQWQHWYYSALEQLDTSSRYRLVVGTESYHRLQQFSKTLAQLVSPEATAPGFERIKLELDPHLAAHEIYIIADEGMVDVSPDTQIDQYIAAITPDILELESIDSYEINPEDEEEQLESLSQQLESILYSPLGPQKKDALPEYHATTEGSVALGLEEESSKHTVPQGLVENSEDAAAHEAFVPDPWEMEQPFPAAVEKASLDVFEPVFDPIPDPFNDPLMEGMDMPSSVPTDVSMDVSMESPVDFIGQDALPFEFPSFDVEEPSFGVVKSPFEDEF